MPVNSAEELAQLIHTLRDQFQQIHHPATNQLWCQADQHIRTVFDEGQNWITAEIRLIEQEWQMHLKALRDLEQWFENHVPHLGKIAEDALTLSRESFA